MNFRYFHLFLLIALSFSLTACSDEDTGSGSHDKYGDGSPRPENIVPVAGIRCELNAQGLVEKMYRQVDEYTYDEATGQNIHTTKEYLAAVFNYPQYNRAVMYSDGGYRNGEIDYNCPTYFAFGANGFAYKMLEKDQEGQYLTKIDYNDEGYLTRFDIGEGDVLKLEWENGNITYRKDKVDGDVREYRYTPSNRTDFANYKFDPFWADFMYNGGLGWWFEPSQIYAWYAGFMGHPNKNLPAMIWMKDEMGQEMTTSYEYHYDNFNGEDFYWMEVN